MSISTAKDLRYASRWFHALADETRLQIIERLCEGEQCVCDLMNMLGTGQSRLSFHLKTLKDAGVLTDRPEGRWIYYSLNPEILEEVARYIESVRSRNSRPRGGSRCRA